MKALALLAVLAVATAGCGGHASRPQKKKTQITGGPGSADCAKREITTFVAREGVCVVKGTTVTVADRAHWLHMKDYDAHVVDVGSATTMGKVSADRFQAGGRFIVVTLSVKNTTTVPHVFDRDSNLVFLLVDHRQYPEVLGAESASPTSFRSHSGALGRGAVRTGTIVFDLPQEHAKNLRARGSDLVFLNFGDEGHGFPTAGTTPVMGFIRLWK